MLAALLPGRPRLPARLGRPARSSAKTCRSRSRSPTTSRCRWHGSRSRTRCPALGMRVEPGHTGAVLHARSAPAVDAAVGALVRARSPPLSRPLRRARLSPVRARDAAHRRRVRLSRRSSSRSEPRTTCLSTPSSCASTASDCRPATRSATSRFAASGCSRTRCAPSACASIAPATVRGVCTGRRRRARPTSSSRSSCSSRRPRIGCWWRMNASTTAQNWAWQGYNPELLEAVITTVGIGRQLGRRARLPDRPDRQRDACIAHGRRCASRPAAILGN